MSIYISKKAIEKVGIEAQELNPEDPIYPVLISVILSGVEYLEQLNRNPLTVKSLDINSNTRDAGIKFAIKRIKLALNVLSDTSSFVLPNQQFLDSNDGDFNFEFENAIKAFQSFVAIDVTGVFDTETLRLLDSYLALSARETIFEGENNALTYIGQYSPVDILLTQEIDSNDEYYYEIYTKKEGEEPIILTSSQKQQFKLAIIKDTGININGRIPVQSNNFINKAFDNDNPDLRGFVYLDIPASKMTNNNGDEVPLNQINYENEVDITPPQLLSDSQAIKYQIKGDSLINIINQHYYGSAEEIYNPYEDDGLIFTLPSRTLSTDPSTRGYDARLQFYLNLLYYYNTKEENGNITEYGIKSTSTYQRFDPENLNDYYIFDNAFDNTDPNTQTVLPNYYRFLKAQELNGTTINFDPSTGDPTTFLPEPGGIIWIPTRRFADSLYYHLNFRNFEFININTSGNQEYVSENDFLDFITELQNTLSFNNLTNWFKDQILNLYEETLAFLKAAYNYATLKFTQAWPRGTGSVLGAGVGITWGYPIATDFIAQWQLWRKMSKHNELTIMLKQETLITVGLDVAVGGYVGFNMGNGKSRKTTGIKWGAGAAVSQNLSSCITYEFPIRPNETALISAIIAVTSSPVIKFAADLLKIMNVINITPKQYMTEMRLEVSIEASFWGAAQISVNAGVVQEDNLIVKTTPAEDIQIQNKEKSYPDVDNIWDYLSGAGVIVSGGLGLGSELVLKYEYDQHSLIPDRGGRVPKRIELETLFFVNGSLQAGAMGNLLQRFFLNATGSALNVLPNFFGDKEYAISLVHEFERPVLPRDLTAQDVDISNLNINTAVVNNVQGEIQYQGSPWQSYLKFGTSTGDVEKLCHSGTESMIKLNTYKLYELIKNATNFDATLQNVIDVFYSYHFRYKVAGDYKSHHVKTISSSVMNNFTSDTGDNMELSSKKDILTAARENKFGLSFGAGLDIQLEFVINDIIEVLKFYLKYHFLQFNPNNPISPDQKQIIENKRAQLTNSLQGDEVGAAARHTLIYSGLNNYLDTTFNTELNGVSYLQQLTAYSEIFKHFHSFLKGDQTTNVINLGIPDIINTLIEMAQLLNPTVAIEGKIGFDADFRGRFFTARVSLAGELGLMVNTLLIEKGVTLDLDTSDPLRIKYENIKRNLRTSQASLSEDSMRKSIFNVSITS